MSQTPDHLPLTPDPRRAALRWAFAALILHLAVAGYVLALHGGNPQWFIHFGEKSTVYPVARQIFGSELLVPHLDGHDGQGFWLLARNPLLLDGRTTLAPHLDIPTYRAQRIVYPLLASPWRLAGEWGLVWGLLVTNLMGVFAGGYFAALLAHGSGAPMRASLAFPLNPGVVAATTLDVADGLALAALLGCLVALRQGRIGWALAAAVLAVGAKEVMFLALVGLALFAPCLARRTRWLLAAVPCAAAAAWALYVRASLGWAAPQGGHQFGYPFWGFVQAWQQTWLPAGNWNDALVAGAVLLASAATVWRWLRRRNDLLAAAVPLACLVPFFTVPLIDLSHNSVRVIAPMTTLLVIDILAGARRAGRAGG